MLKYANIQKYRRAVKRPLLFALILSLLIHSVVLVMQRNTVLEKKQQQKPVISLTLAQKSSQLIKPQPKPVKPKPPTTKPKRKPATNKKITPLVHNQPVIKTITRPARVQAKTLPTEQTAVLSQPVSPVPVVQVEDVQPAVEQDVTLDTSLPTVLGPDRKPYYHVSSVYDVYADRSQQKSHSSLGRATMHYNRDGEAYTLKSEVRATGIMGLFLSDLVQTSRGIVDEQGLRPDYFLYQYGKKGKKTYEANFDWQQQQIQLNTRKGQKNAPLKAGTQDLLSFLFQFMFTSPLEQSAMMIANGKAVRQYDYQFVGEISVKTGLGNLQAIKIVRSDPIKNEQLTLWLAKDYQYLPVKIKKTQPSKDKVYTLVIKTLHTNQGAVQGDQLLEVVADEEGAISSTTSTDIDTSEKQQASQSFNPLIQR